MGYKVACRCRATVASLKQFKKHALHYICLRMHSKLYWLICRFTSQCDFETYLSKISASLLFKPLETRVILGVFRCSP